MYVVNNAYFCMSGEFAPQSSQLTCAYVLEQAMRALPPGQESILGVFDLRGFSTRNADIMFAKFLVRVSCWMSPQTSVGC